MTSNHKIDRHTKKGPRAQRVHKEEATFDAELQRYFMPNERRISMIKQGKGGQMIQVKVELLAKHDSQS